MTMERMSTLWIDALYHLCSISGESVRRVADEECEWRYETIRLGSVFTAAVEL